MFDSLKYVPRPKGRSAHTLMRFMEQVVSYLQKAGEPRTAQELCTGVSCTLSEAEASLESLVRDSVLVQKEVQVENSKTGDKVDSCSVARVKLYWFATSQASAATPQSLPPSAQQPCCIGPPSKQSRKPFKSPARFSGTTPTVGRRKRERGGAQDLALEIQRLQEKLKQVEEETCGLAENYSEEELQAHIHKLHEYNEVKDIGQLLLGKLAEVEGTTTATLYEQFGLDLDD